MGRTAGGVRHSLSVAATHSRSGVTRESPSPIDPAPSNTGDVTAGTVTHSLPADFSAVREARTVVQQVLGNWQAHRICDDVALVASELVANALRHGLHVERSHIGLTGRVAPSTIEPGVRISLVSTGSMVICSVTDPSGHPPVRRLADPMESSGRGLQLVESLSLCWGWTVLDGDGEGAGEGNGADQLASAEGRDSSIGTAAGKSVWAVFPVAAAPEKRARRQVVGAA